MTLRDISWNFLDLGRHEGMLGRHRSLLHRGRSVVPCDRPIVPIGAHRQAHLFAGHAILDDHYPLGHLRSDHTSILRLHLHRGYPADKVPITRLVTIVRGCI